MRLRSELWVAAYLRRCAVEGAPAVLRRRGARSLSESIVWMADRPFTVRLRNL